MQIKEQFCNSLFRIISRAATVALAMAIVFAPTVVLTQSAQAQTFKVIHTFTGGADGAQPEGGLTLDQAGNLFGTALEGGNGGCDFGSCGTVFKLSHKGSNWLFNTLYAFSGSDGESPGAGVIFGPDGSLYGTTEMGDIDGTVFNLRPSPTACKTALCSWTHTVLYSFTGQRGDGANPGGAGVIFDRARNIYGTTVFGGGGNCAHSFCGVVYKLTPSNGVWTESVLHIFAAGSDGGNPGGGVILDNAGNLYGTTQLGGGYGCGGYGCGTVFEMTPSGNQWTETILYSFHGGSDGNWPTGGLIADHSGNLYGAAPLGGAFGGGTVFELSPSNGNWTFNLLYSLTGGDGPWGSLVMDAAGNLYGATNEEGAYGVGTVFKLTPSGGGWTYTDLYDFTGGNDGEYPICSVILDANGNIYGTAAGGGAYGYGVVWEITP
jgi:uncharacterized repeat protein (TIGR03803 family)